MGYIDDFIVRNKNLLDYLDTAIVIFAVLAILSLIAAFLFRNKKKRLKSADKKSAFAKTYTNLPVSAAVSNSPVQRKYYSEPVIKSPARFDNEPPANNHGDNHGNRVLEFNFEYEDRYKI